MNEITALCRAKINFTLDVLGRRTDGYHNIESVMQSVELADTLRVRETPGTEIDITADSPDVPFGKGNTVHTACALFREAAGIEAGVAVAIEKRIPPQAGLGGGSSDAAGAILALNELFGGPLSEAEMMEIGAKVGSDVPFFVAGPTPDVVAGLRPGHLSGPIRGRWPGRSPATTSGGTAAVSGRGDVVERLPDAPEMHIVIVKPDFGVCTSWAYRRLAAVRSFDGAQEAQDDERRSARATAAAIQAVRRGDRTGIIASLSNDFEEIASAGFPQVASIKREMAELGAEAALLCGSGAGVFGIFPGQDEAERAREVFETIYPFAAAVRTARAAITLWSGSEEACGCRLTH